LLCEIISRDDALVLVYSTDVLFFSLYSLKRLLKDKNRKIILRFKIHNTFNTVINLNDIISTKIYKIFVETHLLIFQFGD